MKDIGSVRTGTWLGILALVLTVGVMARRATVTFSAADEDLRDAVASPAPAAAPRTAPRRPRVSAFKERPAPRPRPAPRVARFDGDLAAKSAGLLDRSSN